MEISLNGSPRTVAEGESLKGLLQELGLDAARVVVEHNREVIARENCSKVVLAEGDVLEIVQFVGGG